MNVFGARRSAKNFRLWQDKEAIAAGTLWEGEIKTASGQSVFFIPIITPTVVKSPYCQFELNSFLAREADLGRSDLVFPILYITVPALNDADQVQADPVLSIIAKRQYVDWRDLRHHDANSREVKQAVERFCAQVSDALRRRWLTPEERKAQDEATALQKAEAGRKRGEEEAKRREEEARRKAAQEQALKPGDTFQECSQCPKMMVVPAGRFTMGSPVSEPGRYSDEGPQHTVTIAQQFAVGQFELTFADWDACVAGGGCDGYKRPDQGWGRGRRPVINVSWDDASAYVAWLSKKTGKPYRLLSESEYEYAARAGTARKRHRSARLPPTASASTTWWAMSGSGRKIVTTTATTGLRRTARPGPAVVIAAAVSCAAAPGSLLQSTSAPRAAAGTPPSLGSTTSVSASAGRFLPLESLPLYLLQGPGAKPLAEFFAAVLSLGGGGGVVC